MSDPSMQTAFTPFLNKNKLIRRNTAGLKEQIQTLALTVL
jgi:hypothetical protein